MEIINNTLQNKNVKYVIIIGLVLYIATINIPLNNTVALFYNNIFGKILLLGLIIYYANSKQEFGIQIALLLTLLYIILLNINNTQNSITSYGKLINNNLIGGNVENEIESIDDELLSSTEEEEDINEILGGGDDDNDEQNIDKKIDNIIQEEIVLDKTTYNKKLKNAKKLGAKQQELNKSLEKAHSEMKKQTQKYKQSEEDYNSIMKEVEKYDTNNDGKIDFNDTDPEEDIIQEELLAEEEMQQLDNNMKKIGGYMNHSSEFKKISEEMDKLVSKEKMNNKKASSKINGGDIEIVANEIEGFDVSDYSTL